MPIEPGNFIIFLAAALSLNLTPGNDMMFVLGQSLKGGARTGLAASLGIATGSLVHLALVALGAAIVLAQHPMAFQAIRYLGAGYLLWLAVSTIRKGRFVLKPAMGTGSALRAWRDGTLVNLLNPKVIFFFFAFLPPFVQPELGSPLLQLLILGLVFNIGGTLINFMVAAFAGTAVRFFSGNVKFAKGFTLLSSALFVVLAMRLVLEGR